MSILEITTTDPLALLISVSSDQNGDNNLWFTMSK
jgi:hypothetical protein